MMGTLCSNMNWGLGFGWIFMLLFWGLVIWAIIYLAQNISRTNRRSDHKDSHDDRSMNIIKERYARGEISKEEFDKMKKDLQ